MEYNYISIEKYVPDIDSYFAHTSKSNQNKEKLLEHMARTKKYMELIFHGKNIDSILENIFNEIKYNNSYLKPYVKEFIFELFINGIYLHDIGKINANFQNTRMKNPIFKNHIGDSNHSMNSSVLFSNIFYVKLNKLDIDDDEFDFLYYCIYLFSYLISKHHGKLNTILSYGEAIDNFNKAFKEYYISGYIENVEENIIALIEDQLQEIYNSISPKGTTFILAKLFYSILIGSDYYATYEYMSNNNINLEDMGSMNNYIKEITKKYESTDVYKKIKQYSLYKNNKTDVNPFTKTPINELRSNMFLEAAKNIIKYSEKNIFYLEAPTGSGKTNTSINLALNLLNRDKKLNKLFYIFPFNTLVEQTADVLNESFGKIVDVTIMNSVTPIKTNIQNKSNNREMVDYEKGYLNYIFLNYPLVITTHVRLFNMLFGTTREECIPIAHLANSVIIIDEIQSYSIKLWKEMIYFLDKYSSLLNIKVIIMSATLPKLDILLNEKQAEYVNLINDRDIYFKNTLFKDRVQLDFTLINNPLQGEDIDEKLESLIIKIQEVWESRGRCKILVEFMQTKTARIFYNMAKEKWKDKYNQKRVLELTGSDNKNVRKDIIHNVKHTLKDCLLISTQVIEAGVDIDMDIGFKSISFLDAEEQFLGRINRSCMKDEKGIAYFFNIDEAKAVYKNDYRMNQTLIDYNIQQMLIDKDFTPFYKKTMEDIEKVKNRCDSKNFEITLDEIDSLNFTAIENKMQLIDDQSTVDLFLNVKEKINGVVIEGKQVWDKYVDLLHDMTIPFAEKKILLSEVKSDMNYFIYSIYVRRNKKGNSIKPNDYNDVIGELYYYEDGYRFIEDDKFSKEKAYELLKNNFCESDFI
ncbi:CRISPR-associated helicase Cas3' [Vallitalea maricola]|uniref:CRISPR-associated helicase/endonuclease Cas3 n=1 Tax=Vallitalea maricola TaxID=3074433 RepID=A0ACB5UIP9_9FIRM|nr:CRISPR-associated helicase/endonuclease Cas3 [Vallitalea sp. AN17-2]